MASSAENGATESSISSKENKEAEEAKTKANEFFKGRFCTELNTQTLFVCKEKQYTEAITWYDRAIELDDTKAIYYANRAFAHIRMEKLGAAIIDATKAIELDPNYVKVPSTHFCSSDHSFRATIVVGMLNLLLVVLKRHGQTSRK